MTSLQHVEINKMVNNKEFESFLD